MLASASAARISAASSARSFSDSSMRLQSASTLCPTEASASSRSRREISCRSTMSAILETDFSRIARRRSRLAIASLAPLLASPAASLPRSLGAARAPLFLAGFLSSSRIVRGGIAASACTASSTVKSEVPMSVATIHLCIAFAVAKFRWVQRTVPKLGQALESYV